MGFADVFGAAHAYADAVGGVGEGADADGGAIGSVDTSDAVTNHISFGTIEIGNNEFIVAKIEAAHKMLIDI